MTSDPGGEGARGTPGDGRAIQSEADLPNGPSAGAAEDHKSFLARHKRAATMLLLGAVTFGVVYYVLPQIVGLGATLRRLRSGNPWWLALCVPLEALSIASYMALFRGIFGSGDGRIGWRASYQITMAGAAATKIFATAGSGGVALTVWALRASGLTAATVAQEMVCFEIINYGVYMFALAIGGFGLWFGLFAGRAPFWLTVVPALFGVAVIAFVLMMHWVAGPTEGFLVRHERRAKGRRARWWHRAASVPRSLEAGLDTAVELVRSGNRTWLFALPAWGFEIAILWASFRAFGPSPPAAVLVMGFYVGTLGNTLPMPGGIGGVEGGMIGAFIGFGVDGSLAVIAVLAYRTITYWLPLLPEGIAYLRLRHTVEDWRAHPAQAPEQASKRTGMEGARGPA